MIELRDMSYKVEGKDDRALYGIFRAITSLENVESKVTSSLFGTFDKGKNRTQFNWDMSQNLYEDPSLTLRATIESIKQGTLQLCLYQDRDV